MLKNVESLDIQEIRWHHQIVLPDGRVTPGTWVGLFDEYGLSQIDFKNKRVLDIGCLDGQYSFYAERQGASEVVSIDVNEGQYGFLYAHKQLNSKSKYIFPASVYDVDFLGLGQFDIVLFLGVLYHLVHPILAIEKINKVLKPGGVMILESEVSNKNSMFCHKLQYNSEAQPVADIPFIEPPLPGSMVVVVKDAFTSEELYQNDPSNFWIIDKIILKRMIDFCGFKILKELPRVGCRMSYICEKVAESNEAYNSAIDRIYVGYNEAPRINYSLMGEQVTNYKEWYQDTVKDRFNLGDINLIIFPDWQQTEDLIFDDLAKALTFIFHHYKGSNLTLLVDTSGMNKEAVSQAIAGVAMSLLLEQNIDIQAHQKISLIGELNQMQWEVLLPHIQSRILLQNENKQAIAAAKGETLPSLTCEVVNL
jgi:SAM-dependent methyltransferase